MKKALSLALIGLIVFSVLSILSPQIKAEVDPGVNWMVESGIRLSPGDTFDSKGVSYPEVIILPGGGYRMYYVGWSDGAVTRILSAYSSDGINWIKEEGVRIDVEAPTTWQVVSPDIVRLPNGTYRMYYSGAGGGIPYFASAISSDGLNWQRESIVDSRNMFGSAGHPHDVVPLPEGKYRLYATGYDGSHNYIVSALSSDGVSWTLESGVRVNYGGTYDKTRAETSEVMLLSDGTYRMYYSGGTFDPTKDDLLILTAYSADGLHWTKEENKIVIDAPARDPCVVRLEDGRYRMYFARSVDGIYSAITVPHPVTIDIKPSSYPNSINLGEQGLLPVAILGSGTFNIDTINPGTLKLGGLAISMRGSAKAPKIAYSIEDVNSDGFLDMMAFFSVPELVSLGTLTLTTTELELTGYLWDGTQITGTDSVNPVPPP